MKRIGLLSDTHSFWDPKYLEYFEECDEIWHAGDIGSMEVVQKLSAFRPFRAVYGNCDGGDIRKMFGEKLRWRCEDAEVLMTHIGGYPGKYAMSDMMQTGTQAMLMLQFVVPVETSKINDSDKPNIIRACKELITMKTAYMDSKAYEVRFMNGTENYSVSHIITMDAKKNITEEIRRYHNIIKKCDPTYTVPTVPDPQPPKSGCYVATAVYGSYDCPQVWTLRRYRDYVLAETWYGRAFIHTYYAISPTLVKWFGKTRWFKKLWKGKLDRLVAKLQHDGFEATPYKDKQW